MERTDFVPGGPLRLIKNPFVPLAIGGAILVVTCAIQLIFQVSIVPLVFIGLVAAAIGVAVRPGSSLVLLAASACAFVGSLGLIVEWDSIRLLLRVLGVLALVCAAIVPLPRLARRITFSCVILFHFAAITCTVMNVNPSPWLTNYLWAHYFQYYLNFIYMNNAYHFYAPEPGPGIMLWFDVHYDDGSHQWVKLPVRENQRWLLNYQRRLSLPEQVNQSMTLQGLPPDVVEARARAGNRDGIPFYYGMAPHSTEYKPILPAAALILESYARHIARTTPHPSDPDKKVVGVKAYRVVHRMLFPKEMALGIQPDKKWTYLAYFQGEYDTDGHLKNKRDPYLYWLIPIVNRLHPHWSSGEGIEVDTYGALHQDDDILDCVKIHSELPTILPLDNPAPPVNVFPGAEAFQKPVDGAPKQDLGALQGGGTSKPNK